MMEIPALRMFAIVREQPLHFVQIILTVPELIQVADALPAQIAITMMAGITAVVVMPAAAGTVNAPARLRNTGIITAQETPVLIL